MWDYILGFLYSLLYALPLTLCLGIIYFISEWLFDKFKKLKDNWIVDSLLTTYVIGFFVLLVLFFVPYVFLGVEFKAIQLLESFSDWVIFVIKFLGHMLYVDLIVTLIAQPFIMFFSYLYEKFENKKQFIRVLLSLYILSVVILVINMLFPFILGGLIIMLYF